MVFPPCSNRGVQAEPPGIFKMSDVTKNCKEIRLMKRVARRLSDINIANNGPNQEAVKDWLAHPGSFLIVSKIPGKMGIIVCS